MRFTYPGLILPLVLVNIYYGGRQLIIRPIDRQVYVRESHMGEHNTTGLWASGPLSRHPLLLVSKFLGGPFCNVYLVLVRFSLSFVTVFVHGMEGIPREKGSSLVMGLYLVLEGLWCRTVEGKTFMLTYMLTAFFSVFSYQRHIVHYDTCGKFGTQRRCWTDSGIWLSKWKL